MSRVSNHNIMMTLILLAVSGMTSSLASGELNFYFSKNGVIRTDSRSEEISSARSTLTNFDAKQPKPKGMEGGILFDGIVESLVMDNEKNWSIRVIVDQWLFSDKTDGKRITIVTPPLESGGIMFRAGKRYRIYAVELNGIYQTWDATGSYELTSE